MGTPCIGRLGEVKREKPDFSIKDVKHVKIMSFEKALLLSNRKPASTLQAVYSIPFSLAYWLKHFQIEPDNLKDEQAMVSDPEVCDMATRIDMEHAQEYTDEFPLKCIQDIEVTFTDGTTATKKSLEAPWDAGERAPSDEEINNKFRTLADPILGNKAQTLLDMLYRLDEVDDVSKITNIMFTV